MRDAISKEIHFMRCPKCCGRYVSLGLRARYYNLTYTCDACLSCMSCNHMVTYCGRDDEPMGTVFLKVRDKFMYGGGSRA